MTIDITEYKTLYIKTSRELIASMTKALGSMKTDRCDQIAIAEFHRAAHSFKSQSLVMGYTQSGLIAKILEQIFRDMKEQVTCATDELVPLLEKILTKLDESINNIEKQEGEIDLTPETEALSRLTSIQVI